MTVRFCESCVEMWIGFVAANFALKKKKSLESCAWTRSFRALH